MAKRATKLSNVGPIRIESMADVPWKKSGQPGVMQQDIRCDTANARYFGAARFEPMSRSGTHRHLGPATAYMLSGGLVDHHSEALAGQALVNVTGAVHDVISYGGALTVARVDGPILYPDAKGVIHELGTQAREAGHQVDDTVDLPPNIVMNLSDLRMMPTGIAGLRACESIDLSTGEPAVTH